MSFLRVLITYKPLFYVAFGFILGSFYTGHVKPNLFQTREIANTSQYNVKTDDGSKLPDENIDIRPKHSNIDDTPKSVEELTQLYIQELKKIGYNCSRIEKWGGNSPKFPHYEDYGRRSICLEDGVRPVPGDCIVYSFGINEEWSFDVAARDYGCEVFSFDPSIKRNTSDYDRNIHFYRVGISDTARIVKAKLNGDWTLMGFNDIVKMLGHENRTIDIVKMDVERSEWDTIPRMIEDGSMNRVKQFMMESHFQVHPPCYVILRQMHQCGMEIFYKESSKCGTKSKRPCFETAWINKRYL